MSTKTFFSIFAAACLAFSTGALAAAGYYEVTGTVLELTDTTIVIQKEEVKWYFMRDANTNVTGELKVGAKVTVNYKMTATSVEVKEKAGGDTPKKK